MAVREQIVEIRRAAITKFNADYREKLIAENRSAGYVNYKMQRIEEENELSSLFWIHALIEHLEKEENEDH